MELKIYSQTEDSFIKAIEWNHAEIKKEVAEKVGYYANLVYTEDQIKEAKADRAKLNKFVQALETKRKEIKKQCMQPYEDFEKKMKEITGIVNESIRSIDNHVKGYEEQKKSEKLEQIKALWYEALESDLVPESITFDQIMENRWLNMSVKLPAVKKEMESKLKEIADSMLMLSNLPEFGFEAIEVYKVSLDLRNAMNEAHRLSEMAKRKAEAERIAAERKAAEEAKKAEEIPCTPYKEPVATVTATANINGESVPVASVQVETPQRMWVSFQAYLTNEDAYALADFFNSRNIPFEPVKSVTFDEREQYLVSKVFQAYYNMGIDEIAEEDEAAKAILKKFELI